MDIETAIKVLHQHNLWRRGSAIEPLRPSIVGEAIDTVVGYYAMQKIDEVASAPNSPELNIKNKDAWLAQVRGYEDESTCVVIGQDNEDYFISVPVTSCCHAGPITNEEYCPKCGAKVEKK